MNDKNMHVCRKVTFVGPCLVEVREESLPSLGQGQMLVRTRISAISSGTEMLVYRGQFPSGLPVDASIPALKKDFRFPISYGYTAVGEVTKLGEGVPDDWLGKLVFSFQPHTCHFLATPGTVLPLPDGLAAETACFLPNMETAVNLVQDGAPLLGENVVVFGQGIVGLLTAALLRQFPINTLVTIDHYLARREASLALGVNASLDPAAPDFYERLHALLPQGADLSFEVSGAPAALNEAIGLTMFNGRVVIGSWYGNKPVQLDLGGAFHRSRIRLISSQVSSIAPELSGRWDKARRFETAWNELRRIRPERWITQRFRQASAAEAYQLIEHSPAETIQVILEY
jgi:2-desacetyl-2-hydroxyethyl bacteriochlorophyllide A dehydrogenase